MAPTLHFAGLLAQNWNPCANEHYVESGKVRMSTVEYILCPETFSQCLDTARLSARSLLYRIHVSIAASIRLLSLEQKF